MLWKFHDYPYEKTAQCENVVCLQAVMFTRSILQINEYLFQYVEIEIGGFSFFNFKLYKIIIVLLTHTFTTFFFSFLLQTLCISYAAVFFLVLL